MSESLALGTRGIIHEEADGKAWRRAAVILLFVGATIGTLLDGMHSHTDTIRYTTPIFWLMAWWTPFIFALGSLTTVLSYPLLERIVKRRSPARPIKTVILANALFYFAYFLSAYLPADAVSKTVVLVVVWGVLWRTCDRTFVGIVASLTAAIWGPFFESFLIHLGEFRYVDPNLFGVPSWLPVLYALAALGSGHLGKALVERL